MPHFFEYCNSVSIGYRMLTKFYQFIKKLIGIGKVKISGQR